MNFISIILGFGIFAWGAWASIDEVGLLWNAKVFGMVFGGTIAASVIAYRVSYLFTLIPSITANLFIRRRFETKATVQELAKLNEAFRTRSMVLSEMVGQSKDGFLREGMTLLLEGIVPADKIQSVLEMRAQWLFDREMRESRQLKSLVRYSCFSGLVATVVGLVALLANPPFWEAWGPSLHWTSTIEWLPALSTCFMGLAYGFGFGYLIFYPLSENLRHVAEQRFLKNKVVAHGVALMAQQVNPLHFSEELNSFLSPFERVEWKAAS